MLWRDSWSITGQTDKKLIATVEHLLPWKRKHQRNSRTAEKCEIVQDWRVQLDFGRQFLITPMNYFLATGPSTSREGTKNWGLSEALRVRYNMKTQEHILPTTLTTKVLWILQNAFLTVQVYLPASLEVNGRKLSTHPLDFKCLRSDLLSGLLFFSHVTFSGRAPCAWHLSLICWPSTNSRKRSRFFDGFLNFGGLSSTKEGGLRLKLHVKTFALKSAFLV